MADNRNLTVLAQEELPFSRPPTPSVSQHRIGWVGLGAMGYPMARNLATHGHPVLVFNRSREKALKLRNEVGDQVQVADSLDQVVHECDVVFTSLATDEAVKSIYHAFHSALKVSGQLSVVLLIT
jgi:3-hydroxyisobutyrate dehydrogenase-like beta-hydroxyacid dehydrogenase